MIVVSDTTPIISLMKAEQLELLQKLFDVVYIPNAVYRELTENAAYLEEARVVHECNFLFVEKVQNEKSVTILRNFTGLDAGESEAIILADEKQSNVLLMDEYKGRQVAKKMGITDKGLLGMIIKEGIHYGIFSGIFMVLGYFFVHRILYYVMVHVFLYLQPNFQLPLLPMAAAFILIIIVCIIAVFYSIKEILTEEITIEISG